MALLALLVARARRPLLLGLPGLQAQALQGQRVLLERHQRLPGLRGLQAQALQAPRVLLVLHQLWLALLAPQAPQGLRGRHLQFLGLLAPQGLLARLVLRLRCLVLLGQLVPLARKALLQVFSCITLAQTSRLVIRAMEISCGTIPHKLARAALTLAI